MHAVPQRPLKHRREVPAQAFHHDAHADGHRRGDGQSAEREADVAAGSCRRTQTGACRQTLGERRRAGKRSASQRHRVGDVQHADQEQRGESGQQGPGHQRQRSGNGHERAAGVAHPNCNGRRARLARACAAANESRRQRGREYAARQRLARHHAVEGRQRRAGRACQCVGDGNAQRQAKRRADAADEESFGCRDAAQLGGGDANGKQSLVFHTPSCGTGAACLYRQKRGHQQRQRTQHAQVEGASVGKAPRWIPALASGHLEAIEHRIGIAWQGSRDAR